MRAWAAKGNAWLPQGPGCAAQPGAHLLDAPAYLAQASPDGALLLAIAHDSALCNNML